MTFATAVPILSTSFVYRTNVYWSVIHGIKRGPHLSVVWNWYHFVAIAILHQPRPTDSADINTRLQLSDTIPYHRCMVIFSQYQDYVLCACICDLFLRTMLELLKIYWFWCNSLSKKYWQQSFGVSFITWICCWICNQWQSVHNQSLNISSHWLRFSQIWPRTPRYIL